MIIRYTQDYGWSTTQRKMSRSANVLSLTMSENTADCNSGLISRTQWMKLSELCLKFNWSLWKMYCFMAGFLVQIFGTGIITEVIMQTLTYSGCVKINSVLEGVRSRYQWQITKTTRKAPFRGSERTRCKLTNISFMLGDLCRALYLFKKPSRYHRQDVHFKRRTRQLFSPNQLRCFWQKSVALYWSWKTFLANFVQLLISYYSIRTCVSEIQGSIDRLAW